jgi:hypothetical protein
MVTRKDLAGNIQLLVKIGEDDITDAHISHLWLTKDTDGSKRVDISFGFNEERPLLALTSTNKDRYLAFLLNGYVYQVMQVWDTLKSQVWIIDAAPRSDADWKRTLFTSRLPAHIYSEIREHPKYVEIGDVREGLSLPVIIGLVLLVFVGLICLLFSPLLASVRQEVRWAGAAAILGFLIGAYLGGYSSSWGTIEVAPGEHAFSKNVQITLVGGAVGGAVGAAALGGFMYIVAKPKE